MSYMKPDRLTCRGCGACTSIHAATPMTEDHIIHDVVPITATAGHVCPRCNELLAMCLVLHRAFRAQDTRRLQNRHRINQPERKTK